MDKRDEKSASSQFNHPYSQSYQPLRKNSNTNNNLNLYNNKSNLLHSSSHFDNVTSISSKTSFGSNSISTCSTTIDRSVNNSSIVNSSIANSSIENTSIRKKSIFNNSIANSSIVPNSAINSSIITSSIMNTSISNQPVTSDYTADDELDENYEDSDSDNTMIPKVQSKHNSFENLGSDDCFESMTELTTVLPPQTRFSDPRPSIQYFDNDSGEYNLKTVQSNSSSKRNISNSKPSSSQSLNFSTANSSTLKHGCQSRKKLLTTNKLFF